MAEAYRDPTAILFQRLGAWVLDALLIAAVILAAQGFAFRAGEQLPGGRGRPAACDVGGNICVNSGDDAYLLSGGDARTYEYILLGAVLLALLNYVVLQGRTGATVGKFALGIRTINKDDRPAGMIRCLLRTMFSWIDFLCSGLVGIITYFRSQNHRRVADMIGGTTVVRKDFLVQRKAAAASAAAVAAEASTAPKGAWKDAEPYPGAYGPSYGGSSSPAAPTAPAAPASQPPAGFAGGPPPGAPAGFGGAPAAWPPKPAEPPAAEPDATEPTPES